MRKQKSWGGSTKSNSLYLSGSPNRQDIKEITNSEVSFLLLKNKELQQRTLRMAQYIHSIEQDKKELLSIHHLRSEINQRYVESLNQQFKNIHGAFEEEMKKVKRSSLSLCKHCNRDILSEFEKDYRNLVKYSITLEDQIAYQYMLYSTKNLDLQKYNDMKRQLLQTNHDSVSQLISELMDVTNQLCQARKDNNRTQFQLQKIRRELQKSNKNQSTSRLDLQKILSQNQNYKSLINTIQNQCQDKQNQLKQKIYEQQVKIQKLQKEVRNSEQESRNYRKKSQDIRMQQIEMISRSQDLSLSQFKRSIGVARCRGSRLVLT